MYAVAFSVCDSFFEYSQKKKINTKNLPNQQEKNAEQIQTQPLSKSNQLYVKQNTFKIIMIVRFVKKN